MLARSSTRRPIFEPGSTASLPRTSQRTNRCVDLLKRLAEKKDATPAQIALAWLLAQKPWIVPIPGTSKIEHLNENLGAVDVPLTSDDLGEIESAFAAIAVHGGRMNEMQMDVAEP